MRDMGLFDKAINGFLAAYREGLQMSCPVHRATQKAAQKVQKRREQIRTAVTKGKKRPAG